MIEPRHIQTFLDEVIPSPVWRSVVLVGGLIVLAWLVDLFGRLFLHRVVRAATRHTHWRWDDGSSDILWKNYIRWTEGDKQILLYSSPACFSMLPKRALNPAQLTELREILKQKIQQAR